MSDASVNIIAEKGMGATHAVTAVLLHQIFMDRGTECSVVLQSRVEMGDMTSVTAVLLHQCALDRGNGCSGVSTE